MKKSIILILVFISMDIFGQDIHFSRFEYTPLSINPALTGAFGGSHRVHMNYREQWRSITTPYKTSALSYDFSLFRKKWKNSYLGGGISFFNDKAGDVELGLRQINFSVASIVKVNEHQSISAGMQGGYAQKSLIPENAQWDNQYNGEYYDPTLPSGEYLQNSNQSYGDLSAGLAWHYFSGKENKVASNDALKITGGIAWFHVNRPEQSPIIRDSDKLYSKFILHANAHIGIENSVLALRPSFLFVNQSFTRELVVGGFLRYQLKEDSKYTGFIRESAILFGTHYRVEDAVIPSVLFEFANFTFGFSYDINISKLSVASRSRGGLEFSFKFVTPNPYKSKATNNSVRFY